MKRRKFSDQPIIPWTSRCLRQPVTKPAPHAPRARHGFTHVPAWAHARQCRATGTGPLTMSHTVTRARLARVQHTTYGLARQTQALHNVHGPAVMPFYALGHTGPPEGSCNARANRGWCPPPPRRHACAGFRFLPSPYPKPTSMGRGERQPARVRTRWQHPTDPLDRCRANISETGS